MSYPGSFDILSGSTGSKVYASNLVNGFSNYVDQYGDIKSDFNSWLNNSSNIHYADYVRLNPDLERYWQENLGPNRLNPQFAVPAYGLQPGQSLSRWDFGSNHYNKNGKNESRILPKVIDTPGGSARDQMVTVIVQSQNGSVSAASNSPSVKAAFGQYHFNRPQVQQNEQRIVPGYGPTVQLGSDGRTLTVQPGIATSGAQSVFNNVVQRAQSSTGGDYKNLVSSISSTLGGPNSLLFKEFESKGGLDTINGYYTKTKIGDPWDVSLGAKPLYGTFDPKYYSEQSPAAKQAWQTAQSGATFGNTKIPDLDITSRYTEDSFYLHHYTTQGKAAGIRGNAPEAKEAALAYVEKTPTDKDLQDVRNFQLGINIDTQAQRILNVPRVTEEWEKAKAGDTYWKDLAKEYYLDVNKAEDFANLFRLSNRLEDQQTSFQYNLNAGSGITELEDALRQAVGEKTTVDVKKFGALAQDVLKQTIEEMKKAKAREQELDMFSGFGAFSEITGINRELTNAILGDTGVGGILSFMGGGKAEESLEKSLKGITGVNNSVTYNWQQWFDETLKKRYEQELELGFSTEEAEANIKIEAEFAREFIDKYLIPRFNESRSMNEFVEYIDVRQSEQNPFQTQDILNAVKLVADIRAQKYIDDLKKTPERYFDSNFYFNPTGDKAREAAYLSQAEKVQADWEKAKNNPNDLVDPNLPSLGTWAQQLYRFGVDPNNKDQFARMHFQIIGQGKGYDAADDILNASKVSDLIYNQILPALKAEALEQGTVFGQFITPEEFADEMLKGLDPNDKNTWNEVLKRYGLEDFKGTIEELKQYVAEALRTGSAQDIREQIKYLNEKRQKPTQEILGVSYIEREEDFKDEMAQPQTELYKVFQSAGFQGTEDEFYENFFPDIDRSEQAVLTKAGKGEALQMEGFDFSDPYASLASIEDLLADSEEEDDLPDATRDIFSTSYFKLDEDIYKPEKSKAGQSFLGEFTSMFKL